MQRAHPAQRVGAHGSRAPAHGFRPGEALDDRRQNDLGEQIDRLGAGALDHRDIELALLGVLLDLRLIERGESGAFEKALDRRLRRADARTFSFFAHIRLAGGQAGDMQREAARRRESGGALIGQPALDERIGDEPPQILRRLRLHARRNFFGEQVQGEDRAFQFTLPRGASPPSPSGGGSERHSSLATVAPLELPMAVRGGVEDSSCSGEPYSVA